MQHAWQIHFLFVTHVTAHHNRQFRDFLAESDLIVLEKMGWNERLMVQTNELCAGRLSFDQFRKEQLDDEKYFLDFKRDTYAALENSQKLVCYLDLPQSERTRTAREKQDELVRNFMEAFATGNLTKAINNCKAYFHFNAFFQDEREKFMFKDMLERLEEQVSTTSNNSIRVLFRIGDAHTRLYHWSKKLLPDTTRSFTELPVIWHRHDALLRQLLMSGKEPSELEIARCFCENYLQSHFFKNPHPSHERYIPLILRRLSEQITMDQIAKMSQAFAQKEDPSLPIMDVLLQAGLMVQNLQPKLT